MKRLLAPTFVLCLATSLYGQDEERVSTLTRIEKQSSTVMGDRGLFTVPSVETLNKWQYSFGVGWSNIDRTPRDLDISSYPVSFSVGLASRLMVAATFEAQKQVKASNLTQPGFNSSVPFVSRRFSKGIGDGFLFGKYRLWRQRDNVGGFALRGFVKYPSAKPDKGLGTGRPDSGLDLIFTSQIPFVDFLLHSSMGYAYTSKTKKPFEISLKDELRSGLGGAWPSNGFVFGANAIQVIVEYTSSTLVGGGSSNFATTTTQNPSDVAGGLRWLALDSGLTFDAGYRRNTKFDRDFPNNRDSSGFTFGVSYTKPVKVFGRNHFPVIALEVDSLEISGDAAATITATGYDADRDPLIYSWTSTGGKVEGTGEKVTFRATGLPAGKYTIRATVSDSKGGISVSQLVITVRQ
jgi:hypothetical protein